MDSATTPLIDQSGIQRLLEQRHYRRAFEELAGLFQEKIFRLAYSMTRQRSLAEDMTQDVLLRIWKGLPGYKPQASLSTWVYTITRNACLTELRKRALRPSMSLDTPEVAGSAAAAAEPALVTAPEDGGARIDIQAALERLPERQRQVLTLFYLEDKSHGETAALLGIPVGTVKILLHRARLQLAKLRLADPKGAREDG